MIGIQISEELPAAGLGGGRRRHHARRLWTKRIEKIVNMGNKSSQAESPVFADADWYFNSKHSKLK